MVYKKPTCTIVMHESAADGLAMLADDVS